MKLFTTEAVTKYHPDKYADQISDVSIAWITEQNTARTPPPYTRML